MKKITLGILIGLSVSIGFVASASQKLVMIPQTIYGYDTVGLITDLAKQKYKSDYNNRESDYINSDPELIRIKSTNITASNLRGDHIQQREKELKAEFETNNKKIF